MLPEGPAEKKEIAIVAIKKFDSLKGNLVAKKVIEIKISTLPNTVVNTFKIDATNNLTKFCIKIEKEK